MLVGEELHDTTLKKSLPFAGFCAQSGAFWLYTRTTKKNKPTLLARSTSPPLHYPGSFSLDACIVPIPSSPSDISPLCCWVSTMAWLDSFHNHSTDTHALF